MTDSGGTPARRSRVQARQENGEGLEKKTPLAWPAAFDDDPFSALARRFRFYPGNESLLAASYGRSSCFLFLFFPFLSPRGQLSAAASPPKLHAAPRPRMSMLARHQRLRGVTPAGAGRNGTVDGRLA